MRFIKDIFLFDMETSSDNIERAVILQFGSVLLDKENLLEKDHYAAHVRNSLLQETLREHARLAQVDISVMQHAVKPLDFIEQLTTRFKSGVTLAVPNATRLLHLRQAFRKLNIDFPYDLAALDIGTLQYVFGMRMGLKKIPTLSTLAEHFHLTLKNPYDAFERAKLYAQLLRKICAEL